MLMKDQKLHINIILPALYNKIPQALRALNNRTSIFTSSEAIRVTNNLLLLIDNNFPPN